MRNLRTRNIIRRGGTIAAAVAVAVTLAYAWGSTGHRIINLEAVIHLPPEMNSFKADSAFYAAHASDADNRKVSGDTSFYAEAPKHFIDIDDYPDFHSLPHDLDSVLALYGWERVKTNGLNPWATIWTFDSLTAQLARGDRATARYTASDLGHYVADAHQPLHCTRNYNGYLTGNDGIHSRYESTMINLYQAALTIQPDSVHYIGAPLDFVFAAIDHSNSLVDSILAADTYAKSTSGWNGSGSAPSAYYTALWAKTGALTQDQFQRATVDLACLWYTAWVNAGLATGVRTAANPLPSSFRLDQNFPNPFNPQTTIRFTLSEPSVVTLQLFDLNGRLVETLAHGPLGPGAHQAIWNAGARPSGVYVYRLSAGSASAARRLVLVK